MAEASARGRWRRLAYLTGWAAAAALAICGALVLDIVVGDSPYHPARHPLVLIAAVILGIYALARRLGASTTHAHDPLVRASRRLATAVEEFSAWALRGRRPTIVAAVLVAALLICWLPAYLTWPLWTDHDHFATLALAWDAGQAPWRDMLTYQFPGEIYLFWIVGKVAGWGCPAAFYALDAGMLLGLGAAILAWSRRQPAAGLIAYLTFLGVYLDLPFTHVAQRDWHAACLAALGLLAVETIPGRTGRLVSASTAALALAFRPHVVVLFPALLAAVDAQARPPGERWTRSVRPLVEWVLTCAAVSVLSFAPVILAGLLDDFLASLRHLAGSGYSTWTPESFLRDFIHQFAEPRVGLVLAANLALAWFAAEPETRRRARVATLAVAGILLYSPLHPVRHLYLDQPAALVVALAMALPLAWVLAPRCPLASPVRLVIVALALAEAVPWWPELCNPAESLRALPVLARGTEPALPPLGSRHAYPRANPDRYHYSWADYRATLDHLRRETDPETPVANLLTHFPYPAINGSVGRTTPLPIEAITLLQWYPESDFDTTLSAHLQRAPTGTVVLWDTYPEPPLARRLTRTIATLDRHYPIVARFGEIQIRRRSTAPEPATGPLPRVRLRRTTDS